VPAGSAGTAHEQIANLGVCSHSRDTNNANTVDTVLLKGVAELVRGYKPQLHE
jgi:hypothetical protein